MNDLAFSPATKLVKAIKNQDISSVELLELYIERYQRLNPNINAIVATDFENALKRARQADENLSKGQDWGPLHGVPMTLKDTIQVIGMPCTAGALEFQNYMPEINADVVGHFLNAGAIIFGKTNVPPYAFDCQTYNDVYGQTNNPWDFTRTPGGSSGGSAAALAAGLTGLEFGSDLGGSIRVPAHFCGVYGHKPTFNIISRKGQIPPPPNFFPGEYYMDNDIGSMGPLSRSADDLDLVMDIVSVPKTYEQIAWKFELPKPRKEKLSDFRVGLWLDDPFCSVDTNVGDCLQNTVDLLAKNGTRIEDKRPHINFSKSYGIYSKLMRSAASLAMSKESFEKICEKARNIEKDDHSARSYYIKGTALRHRDWLAADYQRLMMRQKWADFFKEFDVLLCPVAPITAFPHDHSELLKNGDHSEFMDLTLEVNGENRSYMDTLMSWATLTNVVYLPSTVAPIGITHEGLPVNIQIVGPYLEDKTPIHFAKLLEKVSEGFKPPAGFEEIERF